MKKFKAEHWITLIIFGLFFTFAILKHSGILLNSKKERWVFAGENRMSESVNSSQLDKFNQLLTEFSKTLSPSIVNVYVIIKHPYSFNFLGDGFRIYGRYPVVKINESILEVLPKLDQVLSLGTGFLISNTGIILTSAQVIESTEKTDQILVRFSGKGKQGLPVEVLGIDTNTNIAVLKIKRISLLPKPLEIGDSHNLRVGEWVFAIGIPYGDHLIVSQGIVSDMRQTLKCSSGFSNFIVTSAYISQGNSGGALFNSKGEVVGINVSNNLDSQETGISIPINCALSKIRRFVE